MIRSRRSSRKIYLLPPISTTGQGMWLRSTRVVRNGKYKRAKGLDRGKLLYRSEEGVLARAKRLKRLNRTSYFLDLIWVIAFAILVLVYRDLPLFLLMTVGILQFLDAFLSGREIRKDCPMVEVYEMGVFDRTLHWPWQFSYFWPFEEIREVKSEEKTVTFKGNNMMTFLIIYKDELGPEGLDLVERGRSGHLGLDMVREPPELRLYTDGGIIERNGS